MEISAPILTSSNSSVTNFSYRGGGSFPAMMVSTTHRARNKKSQGGRSQKDKLELVAQSGMLRFLLENRWPIVLKQHSSVF